MRAVARSRRAGGARADRRRRRQRAARAERAGRGRQRSARRRRRADRSTRSACAPRAGCTEAARVRRHHRQGRRRRRARPPQGRRPRRARRRDLRLASCASRAATRSASASSSCRSPTRSTSIAACSAELERLSKQLPARAQVRRSRSTRPRSCASRSARCSRRWSRRSCSSSSSSSSSCRAGAARSSRRSRSRCRWSAPSRFIKLLGFSINTLTLFGIILATGIVVDDAIVVIENIERHIQEYKMPREAGGVDAMGEVLGAVIATALVLIAVFVPVAFFPGTTGRLYQQFALTIAFAVALSAFNALTLTPALSALLLDRAHHGKGRFFRCFERAITGGHQRATSAALSRGMRVALGAGRWSSSLRSALTYWVYASVPQSFVPDEDQGYFIAQVQAPAGASLQYTASVAQQAEQMLLKRSRGAGGVLGHGLQLQRRGAEPGHRSSSALKPFDERHGAGALGCRRCSARLLPTARRRSRRDRRRASRRRRSRAWAAFGGFEFEVLDQTRHRHQRAGARRLRGDGRRGAVAAGCAACSRRSPPTTRSCVVDDRSRSARCASGLPLNEITERAADLPGLAVRERLRLQQPRLSRLRAGRRGSSARRRRTSTQFYVRSRTGADGAARERRPVQARRPRRRSSATSTCSARRRSTARPAPGVSSGAGARRRWSGIATQALPQGMSYAWSGISLEEIKAGQQSVVIFGLALLLVYLTLAAQYESLVAAVHRPARRAAGGARRARRRSGCAACRTTSTARSGW